MKNVTQSTIYFLMVLSISLNFISCSEDVVVKPKDKTHSASSKSDEIVKRRGDDGNHKKDGIVKRTSPSSCIISDINKKTSLQDIKKTVRAIENRYSLLIEDTSFSCLSLENLKFVLETLLCIKDYLADRKIDLSKYRRINFGQILENETNIYDTVAIGEIDDEIMIRYGSTQEAIYLGLKDHPKSDAFKKMQETNDEIKRKIEVLTERFIFDDDVNEGALVAKNWALKFLLEYAQKSNSNLEKIKSLGEIYLSNISSIRNDKTYLSVLTMNQKALTSYIDNTSQRIKRFKNIKRRISTLEDLLQNVRIDYRPALSELSATEKALRVLEKEAKTNPAGPLFKLKVIILAGEKENPFYPQQKIFSVNADKGNDIKNIQAIIEAMRDY